MKKWLAPVLILAMAAVWSQAQAPAGNAPTNSPAAAPEPVKPAQTKATVKVDKIVVATGVEDREPTGEAVEFGPEVSQVYCWTKLSVSEPPAQVKFVWSLDGKQIYEHPMDIKSSGRWWATKKVSPGSWKVELESEGGEKLGSVEFKVSQEAKSPAKAEPAPAPAK